MNKHKSAAILMSSPRKGANSSSLALAMAEGFKEAGGTVEIVNLASLDIAPCLACEACQRNGGECVQIDAMRNVYPQIINADILILASPVYMFNVSAQLKTFLDRCFAVAANEGAFPKKCIAAALAYGDPDYLSSGADNAIRSLQNIRAYVGAEWSGCIYGSAVERDVLVKDKELMAKAKKLGQSLFR